MNTEKVAEGSIVSGKLSLIVKKILAQKQIPIQVSLCRIEKVEAFSRRPTSGSTERVIKNVFAVPIAPGSMNLPEELVVDSIAKGVHEGDFVVMVPENTNILPAMRFTSHRANSFSVSHGITVTAGEASADAPVHIVSTIMPQPSSPFNFINAWKIGAGNVSIALRMVSRHVAPGETFPIYVAALNRSATKIKRITIQLWERRNWTTDPGEGPQRSGLFTPIFFDSNHRHDVICNLKEVNVPGVSLEPLTKKHVQSIKHPDRVNPAIATDLREKLCLEENKVILQIPGSPCYSYSGRLIDVRHTLEVTVEPASFLAPKVRIVNPIPIIVGPFV